jgi:VWFA-related protein
MPRSLIGATVFALCTLADARQDPQKPAPQQPTPVFRSGTHYVRVDAYPSRDGRIIEGLSVDDFEIFEDGKPQKVENLEFVKFAGLAPDVEKRDPNSQSDSFRLAADPQYRVFVIYLDAYHVALDGSHAIRQPLITTLNRMLGPKDLFGVLTPDQDARGLVLGQRTETIEEQLTTYWDWGGAGRFVDREEDELVACRMGDLIPRRRLDKVYSDLEELMALLEGIREERKNLVFISKGWVPRGPDNGLLERHSATKAPPIGVIGGKLTLGRREPTGPDESWCQNELHRLAPIDFDFRQHELYRLARQANVSIYPVNPEGLEAFPTAAQISDAIEREQMLRTMAENTDGVAVVNSNNLTDGLRRISNDLESYYVLGYYTTNLKWDGQLRSIKVRLKPSGATIRARHAYRAPTEAEMAKLRTASAATPPPPKGPTVSTALAALTRLGSVRLGAVTPILTSATMVGRELVVVAEIVPTAIEAGRWQAGGDVQVVASDPAGQTLPTVRAHFNAGERSVMVRVPIGSEDANWEAVIQVRGSGEAAFFDKLTAVRSSASLLNEPLVFRAASAPAAPLRPVAALQFQRTERIHLEFPVSKPIDRRDARLLDVKGQPLAVALTVTERTSGASPVLAIDLGLSALAPGDYVIEVTAGIGAAGERKLLAFRVVR